MTTSMLIAYDGSDIAEDALRAATALLNAQKVEIITAWEPAARTTARAVSFTGSHQPTIAQEDDPAYDYALETCRKGIALAESLGLSAHAHVVEINSTVGQAIVEAAKELNVDVIVSGTRGISGVRSWFNSSTAENVVQNAHCPVFVVPNNQG
ncbi:universal stress protein [Corynebacterium breve]|uniref:Universal stress protein n=1 Tax=Corynebacterium breve TaxID=3049799 RepID=A0ABY8VGU8_9CORY|nr:universal stress protein [Corynebacterium breve]WIM67488.1 universal stress protein [Corynebacterium breve]